MTDTTSGPASGSASGPPSGTGAPRRSLFGGAATSTRPPAVPVTPPLTINLLTGTFVLLVVAMLARALLLLGFTDQLQDYVRYANSKSKNKDTNFTAADADNAIHSLRSGGLVQTAVIGIAVLLLAYAIRRSRSASGTRWIVLIIYVVTLLPLYVLPTSHLPVAPQIAGVIVGLASIAALVLMFVPKQSQQYFRTCREVNTPPELRGQPRPGLASLFQKRPPRGAAPTSATRPATTRPADTAAAGGVSMSKAKAKTRSDADAVSRGADLARSRAKASKSRRTAQ